MVVLSASAQSAMAHSGVGVPHAYGNAPVIAQLKNKLAPPTGMAWIWWGVRTSFANPTKVKRRLQKIAGVVADLEYYRPFAAERVRKTRRASITCHATRPGIPRINSRTRAIKESAKAASPGIPSNYQRRRSRPPALQVRPARETLPSGSPQPCFARSPR